MKLTTSTLSVFFLWLLIAAPSFAEGQAMASVKPVALRAVAAATAQDGSQVMLKTALDELAVREGIRFSYRTTDLEDITVVQDSQEQTAISELLAAWLHPNNLRYEKLNEEHYVILVKAENNSLSRSTETLPSGPEITELRSSELGMPGDELRLVNPAPEAGTLDFTVSGRVIDESGVALIGATVRENGTTTGTVTDLDGNFTLTVSSGDASLQISYTGYRTKVIPINNRSKINNIRLDDDVEELQEVVVIAYGEAKAADVVGSVDQVTAKEIQGLQNNSFEAALKGQVAGVQVRTGSGRPDGGSELLVRGVGTSGNNAPLIVIDGVPFGNENTQSNNLLALLNPEDIESVSVIRDASGKALYGSRAGNGLILITTKRGREGKPTINVSLSTGIETIPDYEKPQMLNATELAQFRMEREIDSGVDPDAVSVEFQNPEQYGEGTDWFDLITRTGTRRNANLSVRGGTKQSTYSISGGYTKNEGVVKNTAFERYSFRASFNSEITPWLRFNTVINPTQTMSNNPGTDPGTGQFQAYHILQVARWADPSAPAYDADGNLTLTTRGPLLGFWQANPLYKLENNKSTSLNRRIQAQMALEVDILPGLYVKQLAATNLFFNRSRQFRPGSLVGTGLTPANPDPQSNSRSAAGRYENMRLLSETTLNFSKEFGRNSVTALAGYIAEYTEETFLTISGNRLINEDFELFNSGNIARFLDSDPEETQIFFRGNESRSEQALISHIGRVQYDFDKKYYVTASLRRDASSRFGPLNRAAYFPALGLAWRVSKEPWFPRGTALTNARIELSVGQTGNNRIGNYQYQGNVGRADYVLGRGDNQAQVEGYAITSLPNSELAWEQIDQLDLNLELGFWKNRLRVEATYYEQTTNDLLNTSPIPRASGFGGIVSNVGTISNKGVEFQIRSKPIVKDDFVWTLDGNISANRNKVVQLGCCNVPIRRGQAGNGTQISYTVAGQPIAQYYGLNILGLYTPEMLEDPSVPRYNGAVVGSPFYEDGDGDGRLEGQQDYVFLGNPFPDFTYGVTSFVTWKDFGLRIVGNGEQGSLIYDLSREIELNTSDDFNPRRTVLDRFRPGSTDYTLRTPTTETAQSSQRYRWPNSLAVNNGSFFRISNITLSYRLDRVLQNVESIRGATLTLTAQNPFVFSPWRGNPETSRGPNSFQRNINYNTYPSVRSFVVGINANL